MNRLFRKYVLFAGVVTLLMFSASGATAQTRIPAVTMDDVVKMIDTSTQPIIVNFWASWCKPCIHEIPYFEKYVAEAPENVRLVLVSLDFADDYPKVLSRFVADKKYASRVLWLKDTNAEEFCPKIDSSWSGAIPATLMVNKRTGFRRFFGHQLTEPRFRLELAALLKQP